MKFDNLESGLLPMKRGRVIKTLSDSTIHGALDAIVELLTNSNDSYVRLEETGKKPSGIIEIHITRMSGGHCTHIKVIDEAEGMGFNSLKNSITFSGETSGFKEGMTVRGFFGRGLKESIVALGKGHIMTLNEGILSTAEIYYDRQQEDAVYNLSTPIKNFSPEELKELGFTGPTGTIVEIQINNEKKNSIPGRNTIEEYITNHYTLREICSSEKRELRLYFNEPENKGLITTTILNYVYPEGSIVYEDDVKLNGDTVHFRVYESTEQLTSPGSPQGTAGLLIKTEGAILDNKLFGFETDPSGLYFFGEIICPGIAKAIRNGDESVVDFNRGGLDWRHQYSKELESSSKEILKKLIEAKREKMRSDKEQQLKEPIQQMLDKLCRELSKLAKDELEDAGPAPGQVNALMILPMVVNINPDEPRSLGVYAPKYIISDENTNIVKFLSSNEKVKLLNTQLELEPDKKDDKLYKSSFKVLSSSEGEMSIITAKLGNQAANCEVRVIPPTKKGRRRKKRGSGGIFSKIIPAHDNEPIQRFQYTEGGIIRIFVKFPGINKYLGEYLENVYTMEGKTILAEILIEAFCRYVAKQRAGKYYTEDIDLFSGEMDRLRRKASVIIYEMVFKADLRD